MFQVPTHTSLSNNRAFIHLWIGQTAAQFGYQIAALATNTIAITVLNATETHIGVLAALHTLAFLLIGLPAGAWIDNWSKRRTMIVSDCVRAAALLSIPVAFWLGTLSLAHLMIVATIIGFCTVFFDVAYQSYIPTIVTPLQLGPANGRVEASYQVARIAGPGLAGWLLGIMAAPLTFLTTVITNLFSATAIFLIPDAEDQPSRRAKTPLRSQIMEGIRYVLSERLLAPLFLCIALSAPFSMGVYVLLPVLALRNMGLDVVSLGGLLSVGALGGIIGAMLQPYLARRMGEGRTIYVCNILGTLALFGLPVSVVLPSHGVWLLVVANTVSSFFITIYNITQMSFRQRICPLELLGRLNSIFRFAVWGMMPLGSFAAGALAHAIGVSSALYVFIVCTLLTGIAMAFTPAARVSSLPVSLPTDH